MSTGLTLEAIRYDTDDRLVVLSLSLAGHGFEERFIPTPRGAVASPRSRLGFTREELALRPVVDRWLRGEALNLPVAVIPPDGLSSQELRRCIFVESDWAKRVLVSAA